MNINTPVTMSLIETNLTLDAGSITEVMENNNYKIKINTNENLDDCILAIKRQGSQHKEKNYSLEPTKRRLLKCTINDEEKWAYIEQTDLKTTESIEKIYYQGILNGYVAETTPTFIPNVNRISNYGIEELGAITVIENKGDTISFEIQVENGNLKPEDFKDIKIISDLIDIPQPEEIQTELNIPEEIQILAKIETEINSLETIINFTNFSLPFTSYDEENGYYYFQKNFEYSSSVSNDLISIQISLENESTLTFKGQIIGKFFEDDFNNFSIQLISDLELIAQGENQDIVSSEKELIISNEDFNYIEIVSYGELKYQTETLDMEEFSIEANNNYINTYTANLPIESYASSGMNEILLGVKQYDDEGKTIYVSNAERIKIIPSFDSTNWEVQSYSNKDLIIGTVSNEDDIESFLKTGNSFQTPYFVNDKGEELIGDTNTVYMVRTELKDGVFSNIKTDNNGFLSDIILYRWTPQSSFQRINTKTIIYVNDDNQNENFENTEE